MDKVLLTNVILIFLVAILLLVIGYATYVYDTDKFQCVSNPIVYFEQLKNASCQCREYQGFRSSDLIVNFSELEK